MVKTAITLSDASWGPDSIQGLVSRENLAELYLRRGSYRQAMPLARAALSGVVKATSARSSFVPLFMRTIGCVHLGRRDYVAALQTFSKAVEASEASDPNGTESIYGLVGKADALRALGHRAEAFATYEEVQRLLHGKQGADSEQAALQNSLGKWYLEGGRYGEALDLFEHGVQRARKLENAVDLAQMLLKRGGAELGLKDFAHARASLAEAVGRLELFAPELRGEARVALAKAEWGVSRDRVRALALVEAARRDYACSEAPVSAEVAAVDRWAAGLK